MPTLPFDQGWRAIHSIVSYPSSASAKKKSKLPSESPRPRASWTMKAYPRSAYCFPSCGYRSLALM